MAGSRHGREHGSGPRDGRMSRSVIVTNRRQRGMVSEQDPSQSTQGYRRTRKAIGSDCPRAIVWCVGSTADRNDKAERHYQPGQPGRSNSAARPQAEPNTAPP
jgi:hypothetical protein